MLICITETLILSFWIIKNERLRFVTGKQIKQILIHNKQSQKHIAKEIGVSYPTLSSYLNGRGELQKSKYYRLVDLLELDVYYK